MKCFVYLVLKFILLAETHSFCVHDMQCSVGQYCCELPSGKSRCCDLPEDEESKSYVTGTPVSFSENVSMTAPNVKHAYCSGTQCGKFCILDFNNGICCPTSGYACPQGSICCNNTHGQPWCCKNVQYCSSKPVMCINTDVSTSTTKFQYSCLGTQCGNICFPDIKKGFCCPTPGFACAEGLKCCSANNYGWCCKRNEQCSSSPYVCTNNAGTTFIAMLSILFWFIMGIMMSYSL